MNLSHIITGFIKGIAFGFIFLPVEMVILTSLNSPVMARESVIADIRDEIRSTVPDMRSDRPCDTNVEADCSRPIPSRPPHRTPSPESPEPSPAPSQTPQSTPGSDTGGVGGGSGGGGSSNSGSSGGPVVTGLSFTGSGKW